MIDWKQIQQLTDQHGYMSGTDRMSERVKATGEVFTPTDLVIEILQNLDIDSFAPGKTFLDPACGDGQLQILNCQITNSKPMPVSDLINGHPELFTVGSRFSTPDTGS